MGYCFLPKKEIDFSSIGQKQLVYATEDIEKNSFVDFMDISADGYAKVRDIKTLSKLNLGGYVDFIPHPEKENSYLVFASNPSEGKSYIKIYEVNITGINSISSKQISTIKFSVNVNYGVHAFPIDKTNYILFCNQEFAGYNKTIFGHIKFTNNFSSAELITQLPSSSLFFDYLRGHYHIFKNKDETEIILVGVGAGDGWDKCLSVHILPYDKTNNIISRPKYLFYLDDDLYAGSVQQAYYDKEEEIIYCFCSSVNVKINLKKIKNTIDNIGTYDYLYLHKNNLEQYPDHIIFISNGSATYIPYENNKIMGITYQNKVLTLKIYDQKINIEKQVESNLPLVSTSSTASQYYSYIIDLELDRFIIVTSKALIFVTSFSSLINNNNPLWNYYGYNSLALPYQSVTYRRQYNNTINNYYFLPDSSTSGIDTVNSDEGMKFYIFDLSVNICKAIYNSKQLYGITNKKIKQNTRENIYIPKG